MDEGFEVDSRGGKGRGGNGGQLIPKFIVAHGDKATLLAGEGMIDREGGIATIAMVRKIGEWATIAKMEGITEFQGRQHCLGGMGGCDREPGTSGLGTFKDTSRRSGVCGMLDDGLEGLFSFFTGAAGELDTVGGHSVDVVLKFEFRVGSGAHD